jgi:NAD(P)H-flavin reductase
MQTAQGCIEEIYLDGRRAARLTCPPALVPAPGQYLLAWAPTDPHASLACPVYQAGTCSGGFYAAPALPATWQPGTQLSLRGPLGHGFNLPPAARRVALIAFGNTSARLLALLEPALAQKAALTLLTDAPLPGLPSAVEISPLAALPETLRWADYLALDLPTGPALDEYKSLLRSLHPGSGQVFIETPVPCGGLAECGVCAVNLGVGLRYACHDGPVFDLRDFIR